jgi:iron complex outermembrane recepter protein
MFGSKGSLVPLAVGGLLVAMPAAPIAAQDGPSAAGMLEEIVVTARKREESIQDAPLTIQAFNTAQLEERGVESIADLAKFTPGLTFNGGTSRAASDFSIRGMTQFRPVATTAATS